MTIRPSRGSEGVAARAITPPSEWPTIAKGPSMRAAKSRKRSTIPSKDSVATEYPKREGS
jgi:hypothetical protein